MNYLRKNLTPISVHLTIGMCPTHLCSKNKDATNKHTKIVRHLESWWRESHEHLIAEIWKNLTLR